MTTFTDSTPQGFTLDQTTKAVAALVAHAQRAAAERLRVQPERSQDVLGGVHAGSLDCQRSHCFA